jgi:drug/metabolite transporter (DMT)-like permease
VTPWSRGDVVRLTVGVAAGGIVVVLAWNGVATESQLDDQKGLIAIGVAGFLVAVLAQSLWLRQGRKAVAAYAATVRTSVAALVEQPPAVEAAGGGGLVATGAMAHFHRAECPIALGRGWSAEPRRVHESAGRTPCGICTP